MIYNTSNSIRRRQAYSRFQLKSQTWLIMI